MAHLKSQNLKDRKRTKGGHGYGKSKILQVR